MFNPFLLDILYQHPGLDHYGPDARISIIPVPRLFIGDRRDFSIGHPLGNKCAVVIGELQGNLDKIKVDSNVDGFTSGKKSLQFRPGYF